MSYFDFSNLIEKYSTEFTVLVPSNGEYDEYGEWKPETVEKVKKTGAIISHRQSKIFKSEGTLTEQDRALYMLEPIDISLEGSKVVHEGKLYTISSELENASFTGCYNYSLKYVSVFSEVSEDAEEDNSSDIDGGVEND